MAAIAWALLTRAPNVVDVPLVPPEPSLRWMPFNLMETAGPAPPVYVLWLHVDDASALLKRAEIKILFTAYGNHSRVADATLWLAGTACTYSGRRGADVHDHALLSFSRGEQCATPAGAPSGDIKLTVTLESRLRFGVWTLLPSPLARPAEPAIGVMVLPGKPGPYALVQGRYVDPGPGTPMRRIELLNYVWQINRSPFWIWSAIGLSACLALVGALLLPFSPPPSGIRAPGFTAAAATAMLCLTAALGVLYAVVVPPLEAADEPDHLLSYAALTHDPALEQSLAEWARLGHFQRIRFHSDEHFRAADVGHAFPAAWDATVYGEDVGTRSATTAAWWRFLSRFLDQVRLEKKLLLMRVAGALLFACSVAAATAILTAVAPGQMAYPQLLSTVFLLIPSLPFFAMELSESSVLCSLYVFLAACVLALIVDGERSWVVGGPLGLAIGLTLVSGRSALPMALTLAAVLLARVVVGARSDAAGQSAPAGLWGWKRSLAFWVGMASGLAVAAALLQPQYLPSANDPIPSFAAGTLYPALRFLWRPWILVGVSLGAFVVEACLSPVRRAVQIKLDVPFTTATRWLCYGVAALVLSSLALSLFIDFPQLPVLENAARPVAGRYVIDVMYGALSWARARRPDPFLSSSFWVGFGWLDAVPSEWLINGLTIGAAVLLAILAIRTARQRDLRRFVYLAFLAGGFTATLAAYSIATYQMQRNLHGRYLIGLYLTMLAVVWSSVASTRSAKGGARSPVRSAVLLCLVGAIHVYCLLFILQRYF